MRRVTSLLLGALLGGIIGASLALLLAPASGEALRKQIRDQINAIQNEVSEAARVKRAELEKQLGELRSPHLKITGK
jgi:gas vesicle protein